MKTIKFIKKHLDNKVGDIVDVSTNIAFGLIDRGVAKECEIRKAFRKARVNKMIKRTTKKLRRK